MNCTLLAIDATMYLPENIDRTMNRRGKTKREQNFSVPKKYLFIKRALIYS